MKRMAQRGGSSDSDSTTACCTGSRETSDPGGGRRWRWSRGKAADLGASRFAWEGRRSRAPGGARSWGRTRGWWSAGSRSGAGARPPSWDRSAEDSSRGGGEAPGPASRAWRSSVCSLGAGRIGLPPRGGAIGRKGGHTVVELESSLPAALAHAISLLAARLDEELDGAVGMARAAHLLGVSGSLLFGLRLDLGLHRLGFTHRREDVCIKTNLLNFHNLNRCVFSENRDKFFLFFVMNKGST